MRFMKASQLVSLLFISIVSAVAWRVEIEWHGWTGLIWLRYFHLALPFGVLLFIGWAIFWCDVQPRRRQALFGISLVATGVILSFLTVIVLHYHFLTGPSAFVTMLSLGEIKFALLGGSLYIVWPFVPTVAWIVLKLYNTNTRIMSLLLSIVVFVCAFPVAISILAMLDHRGGTDMIHAIKSGIIIPWLIIALGIPYIQNTNQQV